MGKYRTPSFDEMVIGFKCQTCYGHFSGRDYIEESQREEYLHNLRWEENMNHLYTWDEGGFCDGFTNQ